MPIRYRHYYIQKISETVQKQNDEIDKKYNNIKNKSSEPNKNPKAPPPIPDFAFTTKAPKK